MSTIASIISHTIFSLISIINCLLKDSLSWLLSNINI